MKAKMKMKEKIARMKKENKAEFTMQIIAMIVFIALTMFFVVLEMQQGKSKINMQMTMQMQEQNQEAIQEESEEQIPQEKEIQKYIVRYGEVLSTTKILTEDGHEWNVIDFPQDDKYIRILFDSNETLRADDDEIIDYTVDTREFRR